MTFVIKENHRLEDETFPNPVALVQWVNARTAALKGSWTLTGIWTGTRDDGKEFWCGLEFTSVTSVSVA